MNTKRIGVVALGAALTLSSIIVQVGAARAADSVLLRYKFVAGQKLGYLITIKATTSLNAGVQQDSVITESIPYTQRIKQVYPDGSALVEDSFGAATVTTNGQTSTIPLAKARSSSRITPQGKVSGTTITGITDAQTSLSIGSASSTPPLPTAPVGVGSTWTTKQSVQIPQLGAVGGTAVYSITALSSNVATIHGTTRIPLKINLSGVQATGTANAITDTTFDAGRGILVGAKNNVQLKASINLGSTGGSAASNGSVTVKEAVNVALVP